MLILLIMGIAFTAAGWMLLSKELASKNWPTVEGSVTQVRQSTDTDSSGRTTRIVYTPTVEYIVNGQSYTVTSNTSTSTHYVEGQKLTVAYNPDDPGDAVVRLGLVSFLLYIFPIVGIIMIFGSVIGYVVSVRRSGSINDLTKTGTKVQGVITNMSVMNNTTKFVVSAPDLNGGVRDYISDSTIGNVFGAFDFQSNPVPMDVYVNPSNPDEYYVDVSEVPSLTPEKIAQMIQHSKASQQPVAVPPFTTSAVQTPATPVQPIAVPPASPAQPPIQPSTPAPDSNTAPSATPPPQSYGPEDVESSN